jgi:hypothetical protein
MSLHRACLVGLTLAALDLSGLAAPSAQEIDQLIHQLGNGKFAEREAAQKRLETIGPVALDALRKATTSDDPEISRRAKELIPLLERRAETDEAIRPKKITLQFKDMPLTEAVKALQRLTGLPVKLAGDPAAPSNRAVTLELTEVSVWEALDRFCVAAGLTQELVDDTPARRPREPQQIRGNINIIEVSEELAPRHFSIRLQEGKSATYPTAYVGALRIRAVPSTSEKSPGKGEGEVRLEVLIQPGIIMRAPPKVRIDLASDDKGQTLSQIALEDRAGDPAQEFIVQQGPGRIVMQRAVVVNGGNIQWEDLGTGVRGEWAHRLGVRLKLPDEPGEILKRLKGVLHGQVTLAPEPLVTIDDPLAAAQKADRTFRGKGVELKLVSATLQDDGTVKVKVEISGENGAALGGAPIIQVAPNVGRQLGMRSGGTNQPIRLLDGDGKPYGVTGSQSSMQMNNNGQVTNQQSFTFTPPTEKSKPKQLVYVGARQANIEVGFELKDVSVVRAK